MPGRQDLRNYFDNVKNVMGKGPSMEQIAKAFNITLQEAQILWNEKPVHTKAKKVRFNAEIIIRIVMLIVAVSAMFISIHYSRYWLLNFLEPVKATLLSSIMVLYLTFAIEASALLLKSKRRVLAGFIVFTGLVVMFFSMLSTVAGQFNKNSEAIVETTGNFRLSVLQEQEITLKENIKNLQENYKNSQKDLQEIEKDDKLYNTLFWENYRIKKDIDKYTLELQELQQKILDTADREDVQILREERKDFYYFLGEIFNISKNMMEFILSIFPAVFIDIICPLGMYIALGLYKKEE